jgi:chemotaxis protein methyltransferase CheR
VLVYFSAELKKDILARMALSLRPGGYLILGSSESLSSYSEAYSQVRWRSGVLYQAKTPTKSK